ncbi:MAG TPA: propionyl-CoA synthetase [Alphaproteobacteria bacterium]|nr:propionyl-CoA synthetase [Alphaproteobacteria bacterium]
MTGRYAEVHARSLRDPNGFWGEAAEAVDWFKKPEFILDDRNPQHPRWFTGGETNACYNGIDRHVEAGRGEQAAMIYDSPITGTIKSLSFREMRDQVALFAGVLRKLGIGYGDRVIIYMPMVPEAAIAMYACARIGAIHSVVFGGFASNELAMRIDDCGAKLLICASCGIEPGRLVEYKPLLDHAIELARHKPEHCIVLQRPECEAALVPVRDVEWNDAMASAAPVDCVPVLATDPHYILYTSGTTGQPKGVVRDTGGHIVALQWSMKNVYDVNPGEVFWAASDIGWVVGHSYIVYAPLFAGNTAIMFEGKPVGTPDAGVFWRVCSQHDVKALFAAPTAFRAIRRDDPDGNLLKQYDLSGFRTLFLAGERSDTYTIQWAEEHLKVPVIDHWWQTETGWPIAANCMGIELLPIKYGSPTKAVPGWDLHVLGDDGHELKPGEIGALVAKQPLPPGTFPTLWNAEQRYHDAYFKEFPGYYQTADAGYIDEDGYVFVMARTDDIINVAGHRLSTGAMEEVLSGHADVAECAVVGVADELKGQIPVGFLVLKAGVNRPHDQIIAEAVNMVREHIGPVAAFRTAAVVDRLPKTRSGKVLRGTMQKIADAQIWKMPATIDDPEILAEIEEALKAVGYAKR